MPARSPVKMPVPGGGVLPARFTARLTATHWALVVCLIATLVYLRWTPQVPDLAAQVARAELLKESGVRAWWTGWYGGVSLPDYSILGPWSMAVLGVRTVGLASVLAGAVATARLTAQSLRPRAAAIAFALAGIADLVDGRVTFAIGLAVGAWTLVALRARRPFWVAVAAVGSYFASPLAGLFVGLALITVALADPSRRRMSLWVGGLLATVGLVMALLFPGTGRMPFSVGSAIFAGSACVAVALWSANRMVRYGALVLLASMVLFLLVPSAVGTNVTRLAWVAAAPSAVAYCRVRGIRLVAIALLLALWPICDLAGQLSSATGPSASPQFYQPIARAMLAEQTVPSAGVGRRLEVVDSTNHWASAYLSGIAPLARGWDRQVDVANNPIFYTDGALTASSYHAWLQQLAVGWVAVPDVPHDYAAQSEAELVAGGLPYLHPVWSNASWTLYRVSDPTDLATGAHVISSDASGVVLSSTSQATVTLRVRWSSYLTIETPSGEPAIGACVAQADGWTSLYLPLAGTYRVTDAFDPGARLSPNGRCMA